MAHYEQTVAVYYTVRVEADDPYQADEKVQTLTLREILNADVVEVNLNVSDELPCEYPS
jgi:hypothetical protein